MTTKYVLQTQNQKTGQPLHWTFPDDIPSLERCVEACLKAPDQDSYQLYWRYQDTGWRTWSLIEPIVTVRDNNNMLEYGCPSPSPAGLLLASLWLWFQPAPDTQVIARASCTCDMRDLMMHGCPSAKGKPCRRGNKFITGKIQWSVP